MPTGTKPPIPVGSAKAEAIGTYGPATWANVFYFGVGTFDPAHLDDVGNLVKDALHDFYNSCFLGILGGSWTVTTYKIAFRDASDSLYRMTLADALAGGAGGTEQDAQVAYLVNWTTNDPRRGGKPRTYITGVSDSALADTCRVASGARTAVNGDIATWLASLTALSHGTASGLDLLEMSFVDGKAYRTDAATWPVRAGSLNSVVATQRDRVDRVRV